MSDSINSVVLDRSSILAAPDLPTISVDVPEWGGKVVIKALTAAQRDRFEVSFESSKENLRARVAVLSIVDAEGKPVFSEQDAAALGAKNSKALDRIFEAASKLNRLSDNDIEELEKN